MLRLEKIDEKKGKKIAEKWNNKSRPVFINWFIKKGERLQKNKVGKPQPFLNEYLPPFDCPFRFFPEGKFARYLRQGRPISHENRHIPGPDGGVR